MVTLLVVLACLCIISASAELVLSVITGVCSVAFLATAFACALSVIEAIMFRTHYVASCTLAAWSYVWHLMF